MNKQILRLAIPNVISNLSVPLLSSVDTALVGHLDEIYYLGALAVGGVIFNFIYWGFGFLRMSTTGLAAQAYGTKNEVEIILILARALILAFACGMILIILQKVISNIGFYLIEATPEVEKYAREYFFIRIYAAPATLALFTFNGWFLGMQNAKYPLIITIVVNVVNIIFNVIFIRVFNLKADGVAYATVIAQYSGLAVAILLYQKKYNNYTSKIVKNLLFEVKALKKIFILNRDIFIRTLCLIFTFSFFTAKSAEGGDEILAVNSILLQLIYILAYGVDGFAFAAESLVGKYTGAKDKNNLKKTVKYSFAWGMGLAVGVSIIYSLLGEPILGIFTNKGNIIALAMTFIIWIVIAPLIYSFCFIWDGIFVGATATVAMRNSMLICTLLIFLPAYWLFRDSLGNHSLWLALTVFMIMRGVTLTWYSKDYIFGQT